MFKTLPRSLHPAVLLLVFVFTSLAIYGPYLSNPFIMDDEIQILGNEQVQSLEYFSQYFTSSTMGSGGAAKMQGIYYKPLMTTYFAVIWHYFGASPAAFRLPLLLLHSLTAFLIFLFSLQFFSRHNAKVWSFFVGFLFLIHPVNSEVVLYIADAQDILYMFFGILSLTAIERIKSRSLLILVLMLTYACALLSKETGVVFLALGPLYALLRTPKQLLAVTAPAGLVFFVYLGVRLSLGFVETQSPQLLFHNATFLERLRMLPLILTHYTEIFFVPWRLSLSTDFVLQELTWSNFVAPLMVCLIVLALYVFIFRRMRQFQASTSLWFFSAVLILWFIVHSHILVPLDSVYVDRWLYLATWPSLTLLALWLHHELENRNHSPLSIFGWNGHKVAAALGLLIAVSFSARSLLRAQDWRDSLSLYQREVQLHPWDAVMNNNVGVELFRRGRQSEAGVYFERATSLNPNWNVSWSNLGVYFEYTGNEKRAEDFYLKSLSLGDYHMAYENYAKLLVRTQRLEEAWEFLNTQALPRLPHNPTLLQLRQLLVGQREKFSAK